ncbi:hypothetical protein SDC9_139913 [bioreactor metagenome]|uniref:Uncharacterized protein n=1 Tax=bioreactor metagenome TaxID=1076179 RepID=A0A645DTT7_9ZZZZ
MILLLYVTKQALPVGRACFVRLKGQLLDLDLRADFFELLLDLLGFSLGQAFLDGLGGGLNKVLGFLQAQAADDFADNLDDLDLLGAGIGQDDVKLGLLFNRSGGSGHRGGGGGNGGGGE